MLKGLAVSPGVAIEKVYWYKTVNILAYERDEKSADPQAQLKRFDEALRKCAEELSKIKKDAEALVGEKEAAIFEAQALFLEDPMIVDEVKRLITEESRSAPSALVFVVKKLAKEFEQIEDEYLRARVSDLADVGNRLLSIMEGGSSAFSVKPDETFILAAEELLPSQTVSLPKKNVKGIITRFGGFNCHAAILARSLGIPAVMGINALDKNINGKKIIIDGDAGEVVIDPTDEDLKRFRDKMLKAEEDKKSCLQFINKKAQTRDGVEINVLANVNDINDIDTAVEFGADGVGLFRTEFLYFNRKGGAMHQTVHGGGTPPLPTMEEQIKIYKEAIEKLHPRVITFRTLDIGADKPLAGYEFKEENPALGLRGIRWSLHFKDILTTQLKSLLIASFDRRVKIMFPMVCFYEEIIIIKNMLNELLGELSGQKIPHNANPEIGIMLETPSVSLIIDLIAGEVDFFSIGSNDLTQYTLAVDRGNDQVQDLYRGRHASILRLIAGMVKSCIRSGAELSVCGESASDFMSIPLLTGLGIRNLSVNANSVPAVREFISKLNHAKCYRLAKKAQQFKNSDDIENMIRKHNKSL